MGVFLDVYDICTIVGYFVVVIGIGIWSSFQNRGSVFFQFFKLFCLIHSEEKILLISKGRWILFG